MHIQNATERKVAEKTIARLLDAGFELGVYDGEEHTVARSTDRTEIIGALAKNVFDRLVVYKPGEAKRIG